MPTENFNSTSTARAAGSTSKDSSGLKLDLIFSQMLAENGISEAVFERNSYLLQYMTNPTPLDVVLRRSAGSASLTHRNAWEVYAAMNLWQSKYANGQPDLGHGPVNAGLVRAGHSDSATRILAMLSCPDVPRFDVDHTSSNPDGRNKFGVVGRMRIRLGL